MAGDFKAMAVIALNWELGADYGHISRFLVVATELRRRGHRPVCILRDISRAEEVLGGSGTEYIQAPVWLPRVQNLPPDLNFTETLMRFSFLEPKGLTAMVRSWRRLWQLLGAELLLLDLAPTAGLAARGFGVPRLLIGNSYAVPPTCSPLPAFRWWQKTSQADQRRMLETEARILGNINTTAMAVGIPQLTKVGDLFAAEKRIYCAVPELDVYGPREDGIYLGAINNVTMGAPPVWAESPKPRVFGYLKPHYKHFDALLAAMTQVDANFLIYAPGIAKSTASKYDRSNIVFSGTPLRMEDIVQSCVLVICHAGGTTDVALQAGKPVLQLPTQMEQTMTSRRTEALGAGLHLPLEGNPGELRRMLKRLLGEPGFSEAARKFAAHHGKQNNKSNVERMADICEETLATPP